MTSATSRSISLLSPLLFDFFCLTSTFSFQGCRLFTRNNQSVKYFFTKAREENKKNENVCKLNIPQWTSSRNVIHPLRSRDGFLQTLPMKHIAAWKPAINKWLQFRLVWSQWLHTYGAIVIQSLNFLVVALILEGYFRAETDEFEEFLIDEYWGE